MLKKNENKITVVVVSAGGKVINLNRESVVVSSNKSQRVSYHIVCITTSLNQCYLLNISK